MRIGWLWAVAFAVLLFVGIPVAILTYVDMVQDSNLELDRRPVLATVVRVPVRLIGLLSCLLGASICVWVLYNVFIDKLSYYRTTPGLSGLGLGPAMLTFGWWCLRGARSGSRPRS